MLRLYLDLVLVLSEGITEASETATQATDNTPRPKSERERQTVRDAEAKEEKVCS